MSGQGNRRGQPRQRAGTPPAPSDEEVVGAMVGRLRIVGEHMLLALREVNAVLRELGAAPLGFAGPVGPTRAPLGAKGAETFDDGDEEDQNRLAHQAGAPEQPTRTHRPGGHRGVR